MAAKYQDWSIPGLPNFDYTKNVMGPHGVPENLGTLLINNKNGSLWNPPSLRFQSKDQNAPLICKTSNSVPNYWQIFLVFTKISRTGAPKPAHCKAISDNSENECAGAELQRIIHSQF